MIRMSELQNPVNNSTPIGIIGLGIMGSAIANQLTTLGWQVAGFDPDPIQQKIAGDMGVSIKSHPKDVVCNAEIILSSLPNQQALNDSIDAIIDTKNNNLKVLADLSTLELECKLSSRKRLLGAGVSFLDCPISGTGAQAKTGDLSVYASGCEEAYGYCLPLFRDFTSSVRYLGECGNGTKMKFVANLLVAIHNVASAEAMLLGERCGLDPQDVCETIAMGAGSSKIFELRAPLMASRKFEPPTMRLDLWQKDMALISEFVARSGAVAPLFTATSPLYDAAIKNQLGAQDTAAIYSVLAQLIEQGSD